MPIRLVALAVGGLLAVLSGGEIIPVDAQQPRIDPEAQYKADEEWRANMGALLARWRAQAETPPTTLSAPMVEMAPAAPPQEATAPVQRIPDFSEVLGPPAPSVPPTTRRRKL